MKLRDHVVDTCVSMVKQFNCDALVRKLKSPKTTGIKDCETELFAAALLAQYCTKLECVQEAKASPTPDFISTIEGDDIEFEVTNSRRKEKQDKIDEFSGMFIQLLHSWIQRKKLRVRFSRILTDTDLKNVRDKIFADLHKGKIEIEDLVRIEIFDENEEWPEEIPWGADQYATPISIGFTMPFPGAAGKTDGFQSSDCRWVLSTDSYINSLSKKWDGRQASGERPYVIICDVTKLPAAFEWYDDNLEHYLNKTDPNVSGILLIKRQILEDFQVVSRFYRHKISRKPIISKSDLFKDGLLRIKLKGSYELWIDDE